MISQKGIDLIREFEGLKLEAYPDPGTGNSPWTIGIGHTSGVKKGNICTDEEALEWLKDDCIGAEKTIDELVEVELNQNQRDALIAFIFNVGEGNFKSSTLLRLLNQGNYGAAAGQFSRWDKASGHVMAGLAKRREAESKLFMEKI